MKLIEIIRDLFHRLFHWICNEGKQPEPFEGPNGTSANPESGPEPGTEPLKPQQAENTNQPDNHNKPQNPPPSKISKPYTIKSVHFLLSNLNLDYKATYTVQYSISCSLDAKFPIIRAPKKGCEIKLPMIGRSGKRGACEEKLCNMIEELKLHGFYDNLSLVIGNNATHYDPDLAYINVKKGIFIDIEIDEPYSGWERLPIHYKTKYGTTFF